MTQFDPGEHSASIASVTDRVHPVKIGAPVTAVHFLGENAAFVGAEENVFLVNGQSEVTPVAVHGGGILCAASDGARLVTGGDDGRADPDRAHPIGDRRDGGGIFARIELCHHVVIQRSKPSRMVCSGNSRPMKTRRLSRGSPSFQARW